MEATDHILLKSLEPYRYLFPKATGKDHTIKKGAGVTDTVQFMPEAAQRSRWMVRKYVNHELRGLSIYEVCKKLWHFVKEHIQYEKDAKTKEQVKSARRLIADGKGDCDCMTNFVNACMLELGVKGIINRITAYDHNDFFQHIYPLIPDGKGRYIIMDCVWHSFNKEKTFTNKEDHTMDLQFLDGVNSTQALDRTPIRYTNMDAQDLFGNNNDFEELGKLFKKRSPEQKQHAKQRRQHTMQKGRKVFHKINKLNPATALLRAGILASMKLNVMKVAQSIKWGYASRELAQEKGMDMSKYERIKKVLEKTQNVFYAAGGKLENLRKAILTGRGNRHHDVAGIDALSHTMQLSKLLGEVYQDELINDMEGFEGFGSLEGGEGLGEPATGTAIAAASGAMAALAALIKTIGTLFPNKGKASTKGSGRRNNAEQEGEDSGGSSDSSQSPDASDNTEPSPSNEQEQSTEEEPQSETPAEENPDSTDETSDEANADNVPAVNNDNNELAPTEENTDSQAPAEESTDGLAGIGASIKTFYTSNKKWIKPTAITLGVGTVLYLIYRSAQKNEKTMAQQDPLTRSIEGIKKQKKKRKRNYQSAHPNHQHGLIRLM